MPSGHRMPTSPRLPTLTVDSSLINARASWAGILVRAAVLNQTSWHGQRTQIHNRVDTRLAPPPCDVARLDSLLRLRPGEMLPRNVYVLRSAVRRIWSLTIAFQRHARGIGHGTRHRR